MLIQLLGILDLVHGILLVLSLIFPVPMIAIAFFAIYLVLKAIIFWGDILSIIDGIVGLYSVISLFAPIYKLSLIFGIYLLVKGVLSLFAE